MEDLYKQFADKVGNAHMQLMEGAILYSEFFNKVVSLTVEMVTHEDYSACVAQADAEAAHNAAHAEPWENPFKS